MFRDRIVVGIRDQSQSMCFQMDLRRADPREGENACETAGGSTGAAVPSHARPESEQVD